MKMILKKTPRDALKEVDQLLFKAGQLREKLRRDYWGSEESREENLLGQSITSIPIGTLFNPGAIETLRKEFKKFKTSSFEKLIEIFDEPATAILFFTLDRKLDLNKIPTHEKEYFLLEKKVELCIDFFESIHLELVRELKSPLHYIPEKAKILYFDVICELVPNSNEAELCRFMFQRSIGEFREKMDAYDELTGERDSVHARGWQKKIDNAIEGVNKKTFERFGFRIFTIKKNTVALTLPAQVISTYRE